MGLKPGAVWVNLVLNCYNPRLNLEIESVRLACYWGQGCWVQSGTCMFLHVSSFGSVLESRAIGAFLALSFTVACSILGSKA